MDALGKTLDSFLTASNTILQKEGLESRVRFLAESYGSSRSEQDIGWGFPKDTVIRVNKVHPIVRTQVATLYAKRPEFVARPATAESEGNVRFVEPFCNYLSRQQDQSNEIVLAATSASLFPYGVLKVGMDEGPRGLPWISWVPCLSFRGDPTMESFDPEHGRWCAFRYKKTIAQMRVSGLYDQDKLDELAAKHMGASGSFSEDTDPVWLWEHYVYVSVEGRDRLLVVVESQDDNLRIREDKFTDVIGLPCRVLQFTPSFDRHFPVAPPELWIEQQKELNAIRSNQLVHSDRAQRKLIYDETKITDPQEVLKFESVEPLVAIAAKGGVRDAAGFVEQANLNSDVYQVEARINNDIQEIAGVGEIHLGGQTNTGSRSATEASIVENTLRLRSSDRQDVFERFLERVMSAQLTLAQERMSPWLQLKITNEEWPTVSKDELKGRFTIILSAGSTLPTDRKGEWEKAKELFAMFKGDPEISQPKLKRYVLTKQGDIKDTGDWFVSAPLPAPPQPSPSSPGGTPGLSPLPSDLAQRLNQVARQGFQGGASPLSLAARFRSIGNTFPPA